MIPPRTRGSGMVGPELSREKMELGYAVRIYPGHGIGVDDNEQVPAAYIDFCSCTSIRLI